jgi:signal transduction histidine kinase
MEGALLMAAVVGLSGVALSGDPPLTYVVFPALILAALRFGQRGATLAVALAAVMAVWLTAGEIGLFVRSSLTDGALETQLYIAVAALTTICLAAMVAERRRADLELLDAERRAGLRAAEVRQRIGRDLHDSLSQTLFSTTLHLRTAERALGREGVDPAGPTGQELARAGQLLAAALAEMRALVFELRPSALVEAGLVVALATHAAAVGAREDLAIAVRGPSERLPLRPEDEQQLYRMGQEAMANVVKHACATAASIDVGASEGAVTLGVRDDGRGFDPADVRPGAFGLRSMGARARELGGRLQVTSTPGAGTVVVVKIPAVAPRRRA